MKEKDEKKKSIVKWDIDGFPHRTEYKGKRLEITDGFDLKISVNGLLRNSPNYFIASVQELKWNHEQFPEYRKYKTIKKFKCETLKEARNELKRFMKTV